jgi:hypothetical protein
MTDPYGVALDKAAADLDAIVRDPYSPPIIGACRDALASLQKVRAIAWRANDSLLQQTGGSRAVLEASAREAAASVPNFATDYQTQTAAAGSAVLRAGKLAVARGVLSRFNEKADAAATAFGEALESANAVVNLANKMWAGPPSLRPDVTAVDAAKCDSLEREIGREGLAWASSYFDSAIAAKAPDKDLALFAAAVLRVVRNVRTEPAPVRAVRLSSQGEVLAGAEFDASYTVQNQVDAWLSAHKPASITTGQRVLVAVEAVAFELCGPGNLGRLSAGQFASEFLTPAKSRDLTKFAVRLGWLASWLPPIGSAPPGYSPVAGRTANGRPYRFAAGAQA